MFSHWHGGRVEMLRIIHRVQDGAVSERLVSLDGSGPRVHPQRRESVLLPPRQAHGAGRAAPPQELAGWSFPTVNDADGELLRHPGSRAACGSTGRDTHVITVSAARRIPLRLPAVDRRFHRDAPEDPAVRRPRTNHRAGGVREPHAAGRTSPTRTSGRRSRRVASSWLRNGTAAPPAPAAAGDLRLERAAAAARIPDVGALAHRCCPARIEPVDHLVFTDGVASVSVFVETQSARSARRRRPRRVRRRRLLVRLLHRGRRPQVHRGGRGAAATVQFIATQVERPAATWCPPASAQRR